MFKMASGSTGFRAKVFDPLLIMAQIIALQVFFYMSLGLWIIFADVIAKITPSFSQIFSYKEFKFPNRGWFVMGATTLNPFTCALFLWWLVGRAKQCLDFSATVYFIHFIFCCCFGGFPLSLAWWLTNIVSLTIMTVISEWLSWRSDMRAITITGGTAGGNNNNNSRTSILPT
ncbi:PREDICTED: protein SYS1 homolog [Amphimedon queenslandica]|uniref:Protein SYS1 homolog n=1 Tax=Amphimedon queenslandica TaxID=400682 RepID=A0AAN0JGZ7_AMPQE|nr:PREDICTED: protein SYS1 homolog [Amphimedon queenslandica]|eukprot:XP_019855933.1 PREDICTED: protein SYS1 homolog [Amphimedon queenslandica]